MAIEPISTIMTYQAQPAVQSAPVQNNSESTDGPSIQSDAPKVDAQTIALAKSQDNTEENNDNSGQKKEGFNQEMMRQALSEINKKATNVEAQFGIHEKTNRITVKMVDKETKKVIKELPSEKMLDMLARIWEMSGLVVDEKR